MSVLAGSGEWYFLVHTFGEEEWYTLFGFWIDGTGPGSSLNSTVIAMRSSGRWMKHMLHRSNRSVCCSRTWHLLALYYLWQDHGEMNRFKIENRKEMNTEGKKFQCSIVWVEDRIQKSSRPTRALRSPLLLGIDACWDYLGGYSSVSSLGFNARRMTGLILSWTVQTTPKATLSPFALADHCDSSLRAQNGGRR